MEVYVIETMGGQIVNGEYSKEICPKFLESMALIISPFIAAIFVHCLGPIPVPEKKEDDEAEK